MRVAVAGCGIAGLASATLLARAGHDVDLFERCVKPRPIGSGLIIQPTGLAVLDRLGLAERVVAAGTPIERLRGEASGRLVLSVDYSALAQGRNCRGIGINRAALFEILVEAAQSAGVAIRAGHVVRAARQDEEECWLAFAELPEAGPFDIIVDALGTRSALAPNCGRDLAYGALWANVDLPDEEFDPAALSQRYWRASKMAGVLPIGRGITPSCS